MPQGTASVLSFQEEYPHSLLSTQAKIQSFLPSSATKDVTGYVPVVGSIVEGVGNTPVAQKIGGKEEEKGYLGSAYDYAGSALRTVYDAAGNAVCIHPSIHLSIQTYIRTSSSSLPPIRLPTTICTSTLTGEFDYIKTQIGTVEEKAGTYLRSSDAAAKAEHESGEGGEGDTAKGEARQKDQEVIAKNKAEGATQETAEKATESADGTAASAKETAGSLGQTASDTTEKVKQGHRGVEDDVESGAQDAIGQVRNATGTTDATEDANQGLEDTVGATKGTARGVEDAASESGGKVLGGVGRADMEGAGDVAGGVKEGVEGTAGSVGEGAKGVAGGGADTVKGGVGALGSGAKSAGGALGGMTGLGGK